MTAPVSTATEDPRVTLPQLMQSSARAFLRDRGVVFGDPVDEDDLLQYVTLPEGWEKKSTEHSLWSVLVDDTGTDIAAIFYKEAFYDRDAFLRLI